ncbi:MAG: hypothetical protein ABQ298_11965 [Puniceicoccaceae bacterium]
MAIVCILAGLWLALFPPQRMEWLDPIADSYFEDSVLKASVSYGTARLINAGVSVVKESSVQLQPAGIGVSMAVGQVLDPLDDLTERMSTVLVTAIVSLLAQKIVYEVAQEFAFFVLGITLGVMGVLSLFQNPVIRHYRNLFGKISLFLFVVRLFLPCSAVLAHQLNERLFFPQIQEHREQMEPVVKELQGLTEFETPQIKGLGDVFSEPVRMMNEKTAQLKITMALLLLHAVEIYHHMTAIMGLYIGIFVVQVLFLPVAMYWLLNKILFILFAQTLPHPWIGEVRSE